MRDGLSIDFETRSAADLKKVGLYRYAEHPTTVVLMMGYCLPGDMRRLWRSGEPFPQAVVAHVARGGRVVAHNAVFEIVMWNTVLVRQVPGLPPLRAEQCDCTMARANACALPPDLGRLAQVTKSPVQKDATGSRSMLKLSKPKKVHPDGTIEWNDDIALWTDTAAYCVDDVGAEMGVDRVVPFLSERERRAWLLDAEINARGIRLDATAIQRAQEVVEIAKAAADREMAALTQGAVSKCSQAARLVQWLNDRGVACESVAKGEEEDLVLASDLLDDSTAAAVIRLRREAAKSSTAKLGKMLDCICDDGRSRGVLAYHGASTGRWAGRLWQPQNFPRVDAERDGPLVEMVFKILETDGLDARDRHDLLSSVAPVIPACSKALRGMLIASDGCRLVGADLSNIEGRVAAWTAGETTVLDAFRDYDAGIGPDIYKVDFSSSMGVDLADVKPPDRQLGKVIHLAGVYQGSVGAYVSMGAIYNVKPLDMARAARRVTSDDVWRTTMAGYARAVNKSGLEPDVWTGIKVIVDKFRAAHPMTVQAWWDRQDAAIAAVGSPGQVIPILDGRIKYLSANGFLWTQLPSGRLLAYASPAIVWAETPRMLYTSTDPTTRELVPADSYDALGLDLPLYDEEGKFVTLEERYERRRRQVQYWSMDQGQWKPWRLYGGLQCENDTQGNARDVMLEGMFAARDAGYPIVLTVHDELVTDTPLGFGSPDELASLMSRVPTWMPRLPLAAKAWEDRRYVK